MIFLKNKFDEGMVVSYEFEYIWDFLVPAK